MKFAHILTKNDILKVSSINGRSFSRKFESHKAKFFTQQGQRKNVNIRQVDFQNNKLAEQTCYCSWSPRIVCLFVCLFLVCLASPCYCGCSLLLIFLSSLSVFYFYCKLLLLYFRHQRSRRKEKGHDGVVWIVTRTKPPYQHLFTGPPQKV